jgi:hypothetical protein
MWMLFEDSDREFPNVLSPTQRKLRLNSCCVSCMDMPISIQFPINGAG